MPPKRGIASDSVCIFFSDEVVKLSAGGMLGKRRRHLGHCSFHTDPLLPVWPNGCLFLGRQVLEQLKSHGQKHTFKHKNDF